MRRTLKIIAVLTGIFCITIILRVFIIETYIVSTESMEDTIPAGSRIFVNKLAYGIRFPASVREVPWIGPFYAFITKNKTPINFHNSKYLGRQKSIKAGDIIAFYHHLSGAVTIKRCVATENEEVLFFADMLYINNIEERLPQIKNVYTIYSQQEKKLRHLLDSMGCQIFISPLDSKNYWNINVTKTQLNKIQSFSIVDSLKVRKTQEVIKLIVPSKTIYVLGDNRSFSVDSRNYGAIPIQNVIGKVILF